MNWVSDGLRDHLVRAGHSPTEEARSNGRPPDLQQDRRTRGQSPSTGPEARELPLLPGPSRGLSRNPRHSAASPANSPPQSRTQGIDLRPIGGLEVALRSDCDCRVGGSHPTRTTFLSSSGKGDPPPPEKA